MNGFLINSYIFAAAGPTGPVAGYILGGQTSAPATVSTINKLTFSTEVITTTTSLSSARRSVNGTQSSTHGYAMGGCTTAGSSFTTTDKLDFSDDTLAALSTGLPTATHGGVSFESATKGYLAGGYTTANTNAIRALTFSTDGYGTLGATLNSSRRQGGDFKSSSHGYTLGGYTTAAVSTVEKLDLSAETLSSVTALSAARYDAMGLYSSTNGYALGGAGSVTTVDKYDLSTDSRTTLGTGLATGKAAGASNLNASNGYVSGGYTSVPVSNVQKMVFSTEVITNLGSSISASLSYLNGFYG